VTTPLDLDALAHDTAQEFIFDSNWRNCPLDDVVCEMLMARIRAVLARAVAAEREACAQIVESHWPLRIEAALAYIESFNGVHMIGTPVLRILRGEEKP
jgi:hypothetical protein